MHARVNTFTGVDDIDGFLPIMQNDVLPLVASQRGYRGASLSADRAAGVVGALSLWESEEARDASESAMGKAREQLTARLGANCSVTVERYEEVLLEVARPPGPGCALMLTRVSMAPASIDENQAYFTSQVLPQIKAAPGFCAARSLFDRQTGQGLVGTVWESDAAMRAAAEAAMARRPDAVARGVSFGETSYREILFTEMR